MISIAVESDFCKYQSVLLNTSSIHASSTWNSSRHTITFVTSLACSSEWPEKDLVGQLCYTQGSLHQKRLHGSLPRSINCVTCEKFRTISTLTRIPSIKFRPKLASPVWVLVIRAKFIILNTRHHIWNNSKSSLKESTVTGMVISVSKFHKALTILNMCHQIFDKQQFMLKHPTLVVRHWNIFWSTGSLESSPGRIKS
jgi:hypothetical protein